jgi:hypothetical protein
LGLRLNENYVLGYVWARNWHGGGEKLMCRKRLSR